MKTLRTTLFIAVGFLLASKAKAQTYGAPDTLAYLKTIVANKAQYIGQPFSTLYNNMTIQIKYFSPFAAIHYDKDKETSTEFCFYFPRNEKEIYLTYPSLEIYWQPHLNAGQSIMLFGSTKGGWATTIYDFYKNGVIKDIKVRE